MIAIAVQGCPFSPVPSASRCCSNSAFSSASCAAFAVPSLQPAAADNWVRYPSLPHLPRTLQIKYKNDAIAVRRTFKNKDTTNECTIIKTFQNFITSHIGCPSEHLYISSGSFGSTKGVSRCARVLPNAGNLPTLQVIQQFGIA